MLIYFELFQRDQAKKQCPFTLQGSKNMEEFSVWQELSQLSQRIERSRVTLRHISQTQNIASQEYEKTLASGVSNEERFLSFLI